MKPLILLCLLILSFGGLAWAAPAAEPEPRIVYPPVGQSTYVPPPPGDQPIEIGVGLYLLDLVALDQVNQTFTFTGYLTETWRDPRLTFDPRPGEFPRRYYRKDSIWFPLVQFENSTSARTVSAYLVTGSPDGTIRYIEKFSARLSTNLHLRAFPFDKQDLAIYIHPFTGQVRRIVLKADPADTGVSDAPYLPLPLWDAMPMTYRLVRGGAGALDKQISHIVFSVRVIRHSEYFIYRIFLPLALMVAISWGVLWVPLEDLSSQLTISVTTVLTLVAFSVAVSNVLPPIPYLTLYDGFFLLCFFFILFTIGESIITHLMHGKGRVRAQQVRIITRTLFPLAFFLTSGGIACFFLR